MNIDGTEINASSQPYIIAEISANHNGSIRNAFDLIEQAKKCGASAVKLQTYTADTLTIDSSRPDFVIESGLWAERTLYDLYNEAHTPWGWHQELFQEASHLGITIFSSPFDKKAVELLESLGAPAYKIASFEIVDLALIRTAASTGKPLIISTGLANLEEIEEAYTVAHESGASDVALLHCLSSYPAPPEEYMLGSITRLREQFKCEVGLSDHTIGNEVAIAAVALGATIIEKHFTLDIEGKGPDDSFSMSPEGLLSLRRSTNTVCEALGFDNFAIQPSEARNIQFRRSLYCVRDIEAGETITDNHIRSIRPGFGISPKFLSQIVGRKSPKPLMSGDRVSWDYLEEVLRMEHQ